MAPEDDRLILQQIQADEKQFALVYDKYYKTIFGYIFRRINEYDLARDISSETFLKAFLNIKKFQWKDVSLSAWLYRIATNEINMYFRKNRYAPLYLSQLNEQHVEIADPASTIEEKAIIERKMKDSEDFLLVQKKLILLSVKYQEVISLRFFEEKSMKEIAEILNKNEGTVNHCCQEDWKS